VGLALYSALALGSDEQARRRIRDNVMRFLRI